MVYKELLDYISSETARGVPRQTIRDMLIKNGWDVKDIDEAENSLTAAPAPVSLATAPRASQPAATQSGMVRPTLQTVAQNMSQPASQSASEPAKPDLQTSHLLAALQSFNQSSPTQPAQQFAAQPATRITQAAPPTPQPTIQATPTAQPTFQIPEPTTHMPRPKSRLGVLTAPLIIILLLLSGGVAYGYYAGYFVSLAKVGTEAYQSIRNASSASFDTTAKIDLSNVTSQKGMLESLPGFSPTITFTANGDYSLSPANDLRLSALFSLKAGTFSLGAETIMVDGNLYIKGNEFPVIPLFDATEHKDKWLVFPMASDAEASLPLMAPAGIDAPALDALTDEQRTRAIDMAANASFIKVIKRFTPEEINGVLAYHFTFDLNREGINAFLTELETYMHEVGKDNSALSSFNAQPMRDSLAKIKNFQGEAWIGKADRMPYKVTANFSSQEGTDPASLAHISFVSIFKDWNKPVTIEKPAESVPFQTFLESTLQTSSQKNGDEALKASMAATRPDAVLFFSSHKSSLKNFCLSDGVVAIKNSLSPASQASFGCRDASNGYVIYAELSAEPNVLFCTDNIGFTGRIDKAPVGMACK